MAMKKMQPTGITDRHIGGRTGGKRWRLRQRGTPGQVGVVTELFHDLDTAKGADRAYFVRLAWLSRTPPVIVALVVRLECQLARYQVPR